MNMIRNVSSRDAKAIVDIYNEYVVNSVATFETEPLRVEEMEGRIAGISASYPYLVYVDHDEVVGYCYAHAWKEKAAYKYTLETTVYLSPVSYTHLTLPTTSRRQRQMCIRDR